jgi:hypothetical protein
MFVGYVVWSIVTLLFPAPSTPPKIAAEAITSGAHSP